MVQPKKSNEIGMRRGKVLANLSRTEQLDLIAEGLPILMKSAVDLLEASKTLDKHDRPATIIEGHAMEEVAKILILSDIVRCPPNLRSSRIGPMMRWFYDHLARNIYVEAQRWKPMDVQQLQEYVNGDRRSHYLEGEFGEYIFPNWTTWSRESTLYADVVTNEDGQPTWNAPVATAPLSSNHEPPAWQLCQALSDFGVFTRQGLEILSSVWSQTEFVDNQHWEETQRLTHEMLSSLDEADLITSAARKDQLQILYHRWQLPMYDIDFRRIDVPLTELHAQQDAYFWSQVGY